MNDAGRMDHVHGDEHIRMLTPGESAFIAQRKESLIAKKLADRSEFIELMCGVDISVIYPHLHRALMELDSACTGDAVAVQSVLSAIGQIQKMVRAEAKIVFGDECETLAMEAIA